MSVWLAANLHALGVRETSPVKTMMPLTNSKHPDDAELVLLRNVMKATGCTMDQAKALVMADEELDDECESTLLSLANKEQEQR